MKRYEAETGTSVDAARPVVIRLDGHSFSTYSRGFARPYDLRIHRAMVNTGVDLLEHFGASTAYTESDEISLVFAPHADGERESSLPFNGRTQKIVSVFAGYASARFNLHMMREAFGEDEVELALQERVERCEAHFDARVFTVPGVEALCDYFRWRAVHDCRRNSISMLAQAHFPHERLHGVSARACLAMLEAKGVRWECDTPEHFRL